MSEQLYGYPFWKLTFDENAAITGTPSVAALTSEVKASGVTDLFIFSHGWNNTPDEAMKLYVGFFGEMSKILHAPDHPSTAAIGFVGVIWPSIRWPDDGSSTTTGDAIGGVASVGSTPTTPKTNLNAELKRVFVEKTSHATIDELTAMLNDRPNDYGELKRFKEKLRELVSFAGAPDVGVDMLESVGATVDDNQYLAVFNALAQSEPAAASVGGAAGLGNPFERLWNGAKAALRITTYWQMKKRAGIIGETGLGPALSELATGGNLRIHLIGHSFGARLVSYSLRGLTGGPQGPASPVKSLLLMQGAFSHFAFADTLEFDPTRSGDLKSMSKRVDGPLMATHSLKDSAVGVAYPLASFVARQDNAAATDIAFRWEGMGHDGAQDVNAASAFLGLPGTRYNFQKGKWLNLDGNQVIVLGGPPSGAHSDIVHPHTAWVSLAAAEVVK